MYSDNNKRVPTYVCITVYSPYNSRFFASILVCSVVIFLCYALLQTAQFDYKVCVRYVPIDEQAFFLLEKNEDLRIDFRYSWLAYVSGGGSGS